MRGLAHSRQASSTPIEPTTNWSWSATVRPNPANIRRRLWNGPHKQVGTTYGNLAPARDNVIVYPTSYSAYHTDLEQLIGPEGVLDPTRWFIVIPDIFSNGLSSSPSNNDQYPPLVTTADNVRAQRRFLRSDRLRLWLLNGGAAGLPLGGSPSRTGRARNRRLRQRSHVGSQSGLLAVAHADAGGCPRAYRRRSLLHDPDDRGSQHFGPATLVEARRFFDPRLWIALTPSISSRI
jgi:hypothetical protein